jgi:hypothetical protein
MVAFSVTLPISEDYAYGDPRIGWADERTQDGPVIGRAASGCLRPDDAMVDINNEGPLQPVAPALMPSRALGRIVDLLLLRCRVTHRYFSSKRDRPCAATAVVQHDEAHDACG